MKPISSNPEDVIEQASARVEELAAHVDCMTEAQVSYLSGVKPGTLLSWRKRGEGPPWVRLGLEVLYPKSTLREYLEQQARASTQHARVEVSL